MSWILFCISYVLDYYEKTNTNDIYFQALFIIHLVITVQVQNYKINKNCMACVKQSSSKTVAVYGIGERMYELKP